jgi:two-component system chemotaxis response regulator CheB
MPQSVIDHVAVDHVVKLDRMAALLNELAHQTLRAEEPVPSDDVGKEVEYSEADIARLADAEDHPGVLAPFGCPDCGGTLWELREGDLVRFRCRVGHAWTSDALLASQSETLDAALWTALRALEESASLSQRMADRAKMRGNKRVAERMADHAQLALRRAEIIRNVLITDSESDVEASHEGTAQNSAAIVRLGLAAERVSGDD